MATNYISRSEPVTVSASTVSTVTYVQPAGFASYDVTVAAGGNPVLVSIFKTGTSSAGNIVVLPGTTKVIAPLNPPLASTNLTILTTTTTSTSTVYLTGVVTQFG